MRNYRLGFSVKGLLIFLAIMLPNVIWMICPPNIDVLSANKSSFIILDILMSVSQWTMIASFIFLRQPLQKSRKIDIAYLAACVVCLCIYYVSWICYFAGVTSPYMLLGMAVFPCGSFIFFALWQKNRIALIPATVFSILHIGITYVNFVA